MKILYVAQLKKMKGSSPAGKKPAGKRLGGETAGDENAQRGNDRREKERNILGKTTVATGKGFSGE